MTIVRQFLAAAAMALALAAGAPATAAGPGWLDMAKQTQKAPEPEHVKLEVISENDGLMPQAVNRLAVVMHHDPDWHTYWRMPGESGLATRFEIKTPLDLKASEPEFPTPERIDAKGVVSYGHHGETIFPFKVEVPRRLNPGQKLTVNVKADYLVCKDVCIPGTASASITLPYKVAANRSADAQRIENALKLVPERPSLHDLKGIVDLDRLEVLMPAGMASVKHSMAFFPLERKTIDLKAPQRFGHLPDGAPALILKLDPAFELAKTSSISGLFVADRGPAEGGWSVETSFGLEKGTITPLADEASGGESSRNASGTTVPADMGFIGAVLFAFLGGLILNLMPCVFPVLSLKLLELLKGSQEGRKQTAHGFAFLGGVLLSMLAVSGILLSLRGLGVALGWGFQLQNPIVITILFLLFITLALNLLGTFEFTAGSKVVNSDFARRSGGTSVASSFFTGVLAVVVASPCTAPFMGAALGYTLTSPALEALAVFLMLGVGMALPWLLLCLFPSWARFLPRPGAWMVTFKHWMALPMALAAVWLAWVLSKQINLNGMIAAAVSAGATIVFWWLLGREQWGRNKSRLLMGLMAIVTLAGLVVIGSGVFSRSSSMANEAGGWRVWSPAAVERTLAEGHPAFVDFTAAWCITCQANKVGTLERESVHEAFEKHGVKLFLADWTNQDPEITRTLQKFGRSGVPLYLLYSADGSVKVLPQLLTPDMVIKALEAL